MPKKKGNKKPKTQNRPPGPQSPSSSHPTQTETAAQKLQTFRLKEPGRDSANRTYESFDQMWTEKFLTPQACTDAPAEATTNLKVFNHSDWYGKSEAYWDTAEPTVSGMLGGLGQLAASDIKCSEEFLKPFTTGTGLRQIKAESALDVGAGIGRITKHLLSKLFQSVDLLEYSQVFLDAAKKDLADIQQWVIIYLTDDDFIAFFQACRDALNPNGLVIVKDNFLRQGFNLDLEDASVTRSEEHLKLLFEASGFTIIQQKLQRNFPTDLFPVKMYALAPTK